MDMQITSGGLGYLVSLKCGRNFSSNPCLSPKKETVEQILKNTSHHRHKIYDYKHNTLP